jgi:uncharacterized 2Fe-2S/4Fe-4S cluster protein (DUF4445 family)
MPESIIRVTIEPLGTTVEVSGGTSLQDLLFGYGVEFPCGGRGNCKRCRVKVVRGRVPATPEEALALSSEEIAEGWRLACRMQPREDVTLEVAQWETVVLGDDSAFEFTPGEGLGVAVDVGTTTLAAQLVDLARGRVLGVKTALNPQARFGGDVMSRVEASCSGRDGGELTGLIRAAVGELVAGLLAGNPGGGRLLRVILAGNTVMHHLFCGIDVEPLSHAPFESPRGGLETLRARDLGWQLPDETPVKFLPCLGGFVGSDILAGILATRMHESGPLIGLIDLGTNGEIVLGNRERIVCASTAAGPAFEAGRISMGMRAATGAIDEVSLTSAGPVCHVLGGGPPRGLCGSGLVDAIGAGLDLGLIDWSGRMANGGQPWMLAAPVSITQSDVRELQLAKAAIAAGIKILLRRWGAATSDVARLHMAGAFGNYVSRSSARRIGLIPFPEDVAAASGNTALLGAKLALFDESGEFAAIRRRVEHVPLAADARFQDIFVEEMAFPAIAG